jgi:hypothetical protein
VEDDKEELAKKRSEVTDLLFETMPSRVMEVLDAGKVLPCHHAQRASRRGVRCTRALLAGLAAVIIRHVGAGAQECGRCAALYEHLQQGIEDLSKRCCPPRQPCESVALPRSAHHEVWTDWLLRPIREQRIGQAWLDG